MRRSSGASAEPSPEIVPKEIINKILELGQSDDPLTSAEWEEYKKQAIDLLAPYSAISGDSLLRLINESDNQIFIDGLDDALCDKFPFQIKAHVRNINNHPEVLREGALVRLECISKSLALEEIGETLSMGK